MIQLYLMGVIYTILGVVHFTHTGFYRPLMPKFLPVHDLLIYLSGIAEIVLGIGVLFPQTRSVALRGLIVMLIVFLIVHINMLFPSNQLGISPLDSMVKKTNSVHFNLLGLSEFSSSINLNQFHILL
jgi:uncharacterized membrane protein